MEKYDTGLSIIALAQQAAHDGNNIEAHAHFVKGIEELMKLLQDEKSEDTKTLVRKHVARFMGMVCVCVCVCVCVRVCVLTIYSVLQGGEDA